MGIASRIEATSPATIPVWSETRAGSGCSARSVQKAPTAAIAKAPVVTAPSIVWGYWASAHGLVRKVQRLATAKVPSGWIRCPTGCCMKAFVATMKKPESQLPTSSATAAAKCPRRPSRRSPQTSRARKLDSRKKAKSPSIASVCPMTPPVRAEKAAQLVPNWNSIGTPVTTPMANERPKMRIQKRAASSHFWVSLRRPIALRTTMSSARPIVSCGKR